MSLLLEVHSKYLMDVFIDCINEWMMSDRPQLTLFVNWVDFEGSSSIQQPLLCRRGCETTLTPGWLRGFLWRDLYSLEQRAFPPWWVRLTGWSLLPGWAEGTREWNGWGLWADVPCRSLSRSRSYTEVQREWITPFLSPKRKLCSITHWNEEREEQLGNVFKSTPVYFLFLLYSPLPPPTHGVLWGCLCLHVCVSWLLAFFPSLVLSWKESKTGLKSIWK